MNLLELFAGSCSITKTAKDLGWNTFCSDIENFDNIDYVVDILNFDVNKVPFKPDVIWASPPCQAFSVAKIGMNWFISNGKPYPKTDKAILGLKLLDKTLEIIKYFDPKYFFIENPRGMMRKMPQLPIEFCKTVTYCQYGETRMKPTDIWTNNPNWVSRPMCKNGDPCHEAAPRGSRTGTQGMKNAYERSIIPKELCIEILKSCY